MSGEKPMPSKATGQAYVRRMRQLTRRYLRETGALPTGSEITILLALIRWLIGLRDTLKPAAWRQYRAAAIFTLERSLDKAAATSDPSSGLADELRAAIALLATTRHSRAASLPPEPRTSARKMRRFPPQDAARVLAVMATYGARAAPARAFLQAALATGLRPCEWQHARLDGGVLTVKNAKAGRGRAHGHERTLTLPVDSDEAVAVRAWLDIVQSSPSIPLLLRRVGDTIGRASRQLWPRRRRHYSLYSCRHEVAARSKLRFDPAEVAALMGHATDITASHHYARYRPGSRLPPDLQAAVDRLPTPCPTEVARVRRDLGASLARIPRRTAILKPI